MSNLEPDLSGLLAAYMQILTKNKKKIKSMKT